MDCEPACAKLLPGNQMTGGVMGHRKRACQDPAGSVRRAAHFYTPLLYKGKKTGRFRHFGKNTIKYFSILRKIIPIGRCSGNTQ
jgi:hypothetical protein